MRICGRTPISVFSGLLDFLAIPRQDDELQQAVADADFENMKRIELSGDGPRYPSSGYNIFAHGNRNNADALHVRRGKVGGFYDYLQQHEADRLSDLINRRLPDFFSYSNDSRRGA